MSSGFGGFGGFGQSNNQPQQSSGFGGFGTNNNTNAGGFGSTNNAGGFGSTNTNTTGGGLFGSTGSTGAFGNSGGFGSTQNNAFGAPKPFGTPATTSSGGGLFGGGGTATAGSAFGGFGQTTAPSTGGFGSTNTGGGLFGSKPAFGTNTTSTSTPFGGTSTSSPFGGGGAFGSGTPPSTALGGSVGECQGTGSVPFSAYVEKEPNSTSNQQNSFQSIGFQQPYQKFSPEELRLADYTQGRRYGNQSNQPGAFGANTNFGSFGSNTQSTTSAFGASTTGTGSSLFGGGTGTGFGATSQPSTGFGSNTATSGGLFGAAKPASGGLFGSQPQTQPSGGLFGSGGTTGFGATTTGGGFGTTNNAATGSSLFGASNTAAKPAFSFGTTPASTSTGFGSTPAASGGFGSGGLFGSNNTSTPFGGQQQPTQQPAATNTFGGFGNTQPQTGSSLFGNTQQKPATTGLFGQPAASGGLFGSTQPAANTNTNPFGTSTNNQGTGGLFGAKPAATGTSLFGAPQNTQTNTTGGGLFGGGFGNQNQNQNQTQQNTAGGLFGLGNNNQPKPSLFGTTQPQQQPLGGSLFGNTGSQSQGGLFGSTNQQPQQQQQQPQNSLFGANSLFGGSPQNQNQNQQSLTTSISDPNAFGSSIFSQLGAGQNIANPGPLVTPLSGSKPKKSAALPIYKLNPASSSRFTTPVKRGFGFSYSNYASPGSASSTASTPGGNLNGSLLGGSLGRGLSKSISTSSLRRSFTTEDSILAPGAFSASPSARHYGSTGSMKKLVINRSLRGDLFSPPPPSSQQPPSTPTNGIMKKRVSWDANTTQGGNKGAPSPLKEVQGNASPSPEDLGYLRPKNGSKPNGTSGSPEMEQVKNNELAIVHEEETTTPSASKQVSRIVSLEDQEPGQYWMEPSKDALAKMSRADLEHIQGFTVGRDGVGKVTFKSEVNLNKINLDEIFDNIVVLTIRSCTVYPNSAKKPPVGHGLNVPSVISLLNSWPRGKDKRTPTGDKSGPRLKKHIDRLQRVEGTNFLDYEKETGTWTFSVEHFTTYKLDLDEDEDDGESINGFGQSTLSAPPDTPTPKTRTPKVQNHDESFASTQLTHTESDPEDTFHFRKKKALPGAFDDEDFYEDDEGMEDGSFEENQQSFLDKRSVGSQSEDGVEEPMDQDDLYDDESVSIVDQEMAGSFPQVDNTAEHDEDSQDEEEMDGVEETPGGLMRVRMRALNSASPQKRMFTAGNDWAATLQTTISPKKQDRALLKSLIDGHGNDSRPDSEQILAPRNRVVSDGRGFATSIDLMNSLFGQARSPTKIAKVSAQSKGFEWPYAKRPKTADNDTSNMTEHDRAFHDSMKPSWGPDGTLVYAVSSNAKPLGRASRRARERDGLLTIQKGGVVSESRDVQFAKFSNEASADALKNHKAMATINNSGNVPYASLPDAFSFSGFFHDGNIKNPAVAHEKLVWGLASILFDPIVVPDELKSLNGIMDRLRKDNLSNFWEKLVDHASSRQVALLRSNEEKAIASLSGHRIPDACGHLLNGKDFHLATLVAQIGGGESMRKDIREQLNEWQKSKILPEFSPQIRALYEILAGNVCVCDGSKGGPIEDRIESFVISKRFGLDWRQAFGLRLWYGILAGEDIKVAVEKFADDLKQDRETSKPHTWYVEQKVPVLWEDSELENREDLLWGLLQLYTFPDADLEAIIRPENSQLSPLDTRLSWQLSRALTSRGGVSYSHDSDDKADYATLSFAAQLTNEGSWLDAVFVLLHLSSADARAKSIQDHLAHHAGQIGSEDSQSFVTLTQSFKIPATWIWEAKALYMRSVKKDPQGEVDCLVKAGSFEEAHRTFTKDVAPKTIIERDYITLRTLLDGFRGREQSIAEWHLGGEIYNDFLDLLAYQKAEKALDYTVLDRLLVGLPAAVEDTRNPSFMETVAIETISGIVAKAVATLGQKGDKGDLPKILRLPLTEDNYLKHTVELSLGYYRDIMAGGR